MKKILIINKSLQKGGVQTALINMLEEIKHEYIIELLIFSDEHLNIEGISILKSNFFLKAISLERNQLRFFKTPFLYIYKTIISAWTKIFGNKVPIFITLFFQKRLKGYDLAISFHHDTNRKTSVAGFPRYIAKCVEATRKVSWIHYDQGSFKMNNKNNLKAYHKMDNLVFVTENAKDNFLFDYPQFSNKCVVIYNFLSFKNIESSRKTTVNFSDVSGKIIFFSAIRFQPEKAIDRTLKILKEVIKTRNNFKWFIAGDGKEFLNIKRVIKELELSEYVNLLGMIENPLPYMAKADVFLLLSRHEAGPMVIFESLAMGTPIFASKTAGSLEFVNDSIGWICNNDFNSIKEKFIEILDNYETIEIKKNNVSKLERNNLKSLERFEKLVEGKL